MVEAPRSLTCREANDAFCAACLGTGEAIGPRTRALIADLERERNVLADERDRALARLDQWTGGDAA